jgi:hypothetical protein
MIKKLLFLLLLIHQFSNAQNTVGTIAVTNDVYDGYTLFSSFKKTFLINNCGQVVNEWTSDFPPGNAVYLLPNGNLLRAGRENDKSDIIFGGQGGIVELYNWEGVRIWSYSFNSNQERQHHDVYPMPNGNILVLIAESWSKQQAIEHGRDPSKITEERLYNEKIIEVKPIGSNQFDLVWEWNINDHLIQDFDNTKFNFGDVSKAPEKLDINFLNDGNGSANWLHINSIQYNEARDQIVLSSRNLSEIYIIDHSTTTAEATTSSGGNSNKGGDFLYRWGNPQAYKQGGEEDQKLFGQHYAYFIDKGFSFEDKIIVFNNGNGRDPKYSEIFILEPKTTNGLYDYLENTAFGPENLDYVYSQFDGVNDSDFYSRIVSGAQMLPNGNILICEGAEGKFFEIDSNEQVVWSYINPSSNLNGEIVSQGDAPKNNLTFRALKYSRDYKAFEGKTLNVGNPIEKNFNLDACATLNTNKPFFNEILTISPNPSSGIFKLNIKVDKITIYDYLGKEILEVEDTNKIDLYNYSKGLYFIKILKEGKATTRKIIKN